MLSSREAEKHNSFYTQGLLLSLVGQSEHIPQQMEIRPEFEEVSV